MQTLPLLGLLTCLLLVSVTLPGGGAVRRKRSHDGTPNTFETSETHQSHPQIDLKPLQNCVSNLETSLQNYVSRRENKVSSLETSLQTKVSSLETSLQTKVSSLETSLQNNVSSLETSLQKNVSSLETSLQTKVSSLETSLQNNVSSLETSLQNNVSSLETSLQNKVSSLETSLQTKVSSLETSLQNNVSSLESSLDSLQNATSGAVAFTARISTVRDSNHRGLPLVHQETIVFDEVLTNVGNAYNNHTGLFTAPVDGTYVFFLTIMGVAKWSDPDSKDIYLAIVKNGVVLDFVFAHGRFNFNDQGSTQVSTQLRQGDHVWVRQSRGNAVRGEAWTVFTGYLLHAQ